MCDIGVCMCAHVCACVCTYASVCSDMESYLYFLWYAGIYESYGNLFKILIFFPSEVSIAQSCHCIQELYFEARDEEQRLFLLQKCCLEPQNRQVTTIS